MNQFIYIVEADTHYEGSVVLGYYSSRAKAEEFIDNLMAQPEDELMHDREQLKIRYAVLDDTSV